MSQRAAADTSPALQASSSLTESSAATPTSTPSSTPSRSASVPTSTFRDMQTSKTMDETSTEQPVSAAERGPGEEPNSTLTIEQKKEAVEEASKTASGKTKKKAKCTKPEHKKKSKKGKAESKSKKASKPESSDDSSSSASSSEEEDEEESDSDSSSSEDDKTKKRKAKKAKALKKAKDKKRKKSKKVETESESSESESSESEESESSSEEETPKKKKKSAKKAKKAAAESESDDADETPADAAAAASLLDLQTQIEAMKLAMATGKTSKKVKPKRRSSSSSAKSSKGKKKAEKKGSLTFKKVDQLWDTNTHQWTLKESAGEDDSEFAEYAFLVRRTFDWENKYQSTLVDIKAKQLKAALADVMKGCKSISFEAEEPTIDPNLLFLYLEELRTHYKKTLKAKIKTEKKRKAIKKLESQRTLVKTLVQYIDEDYEDTKKTLYPLLKAGNITFDLLWALYKPNEIAISSCYGDWNEPRCFKIDFSHKFSSMTKGEWYCVEGKYMEYDGKHFGLGDFEADVDGFKGPRKITSLACYPLKYHKDPEGVKKSIIERGSRFVSLVGMNYRFHKGMAYMKKKKQVLKININGRVMVDPQLFRKINANYPISIIKPHENEELFSDESDDDGCSCCGSDDEDAHGAQAPLENSDDHAAKIKYKLVQLKDGIYNRVPVEVDDNGDPIRKNKLDQIDTTENVKSTFTSEELLLTSPVVLGFAFSEKLWLEFSLSGICDIEYNETAFDSLVLPTNQKSIVRALVESHKFHAAKTIDDVVQGKGKGLVAVLHGPPGTGKTLTAEGISELLKCPLYMVSAGELGTDPGRLETELQKILDIAHAWGAVLLLDEADVFLEKRETHDIHRNALVSIFLRLLEYFQGILFLTTNRVETFDDAFQSRIHVALRYGDLTTKAKKAVWKMFIDICRKQKDTKVADFSEAELDALSRRVMNGRQIKNAVRTAQALALNEEGVLGMEQVRRVLDVAESFERDLKGGTGYEDAMRSYT